MNKTSYIAAASLVVIWAIMFFGFNLYQHNTYRIVHLILVIAVMLVLYKVLTKKKQKNNEYR